MTMSTEDKIVDLTKLDKNYYIKQLNKLNSSYLWFGFYTILWIGIAELLPIYSMCIAAYKIDNTYVDIGCLFGILWVFGGIYKTVGNLIKRTEKHKKEKNRLNREIAKYKVMETIKEREGDKK